ncbi:MAG: ferritin [Alphaproteobacteria bacterium CG_4_10_14_0_2_um_filter_63_37]|nr:MAG: ferritin [Proteobacteria bacterium CG1_02_64_396]PJA24940.1 MAG: ferritin [Alphaproteobacteria bacterium CG_4_10_14_0_2_um_filter_63_37]
MIEPPSAIEGVLTREALIELLNEDLRLEYTAMIQYIQHSAVMKGAQYRSIQQELVVHAAEEHQHALLLANEIDYLGGTPAVDVRHVVTSEDQVAMLQQDLVGEKVAITRYKERMKQAEALGEYALKRVLEDILTQEQEHERDILDALG